MLKLKRKRLNYKTFVKRFKLFLYNLLENDRNSLNHIYSIFAIFLVLTSSITVFLLISPKSERLPHDLHTFLKDFEEFTLFFFLIEYILRWWVVSDFTEDFKDYLTEHKQRNLKVYFDAFLYALKPKLKWMIMPYSIIDLLAILPIIRPLRMLRIFQLIRLIKLLRYSSVFRNFFFAFKENSFVFTFTFSSLFVNIILFSFLTYIYEHNAGNKNFDSIWAAIYWGIITSFTVGYGDIVPISDVGKIAASLMVIINVILVSVLTAGFSVSFINKLLELKEGEIVMRDLRDHIVICGYNETSEEILEKIIESDIDKEKPVVLLTNYDKKDLRVELSKYILYKKGDFILEKNLLDVGIENASDVIIVGEKLQNLSERDIDARTALAGMLIKTLNPTVKLYIEVLLDEDAEIFKKRVGAREVLIHGQIVGKIMFSSLLNPGATSLIETLLDVETGIQKVKVRELGSYKTFGEIIKIVRKDGYLPIAVERSKKIILNPKDDFEIQKSDAIFLIPKGESH